jgi:hypothetical protein
VETEGPLVLWDVVTLGESEDGRDSGVSVGQDGVNPNVTHLQEQGQEESKLRLVSFMLYGSGSGQGQVRSGQVRSG